MVPIITEAGARSATVCKVPSTGARIQRTAKSSRWHLALVPGPKLAAAPPRAIVIEASFHRGVVKANCSCRRHEIGRLERRLAGVAPITVIGRHAMRLSHAYEARALAGAMSPQVHVQHLHEFGASVTRVETISILRFGS